MSFPLSHLYIILEFMENGSLSSIIKQCGTLNEELAAVYVAQVLKGLQYLHEQGVVHRDIKGANILTTKEVSRGFENIDDLASVEVEWD